MRLLSLALAAPVVAAAAAAALLGRARAVTMEAAEVFSGVNCAGTPDVLAMYNLSASCVEDACSDIAFGNDTYYISRTCNVSDRFAHTAAVFGDFTYVIMETYDNKSCVSFGEADVFLASGSCEISSGLGDQSVITSLYPNGSAVVALYPNDACGGDPSLYFELEKEALSTGSCQQGLYRFYSSDTGASSSSSSSSGSSGSLDTAAPQAAGSDSGSSSASNGSGISTGAVVGIAAGALVLVLIVAVSVVHRLRKKCEAQREEENDNFSSFQSPSGGRKPGASTAPDTTNSLGDDGSSGRMSAKPAGLVGLWDDEVIATARVPREKVIAQHIISRGGGGEVYLGLFNHRRIAVKMLLPEVRKSVKHVNAFLAEVKLMATLEHARIVEFVGVAWDSLTDLCVVSEYMEGGDLRALLSVYEQEQHATGFDRSKVTIALHVAHALTYLHSLETPVLHRDLKSKNVLLTSSLEAKLTDFGISRERGDKTMTAGVGTSRWMAPEVMLGHKYDDKADMFSFGVVLSELDVHVLPYSHAKDCGDIDSVSEAVIMQMVALGKLQVEFSTGSLQSMVDLGMACVSLDPTQRPTAAEALYRLHTILSQEL